MRFASLGSGSRGNATLVEASGSLLLVDAGFSPRETERRMARLGCHPADLTAILVTHEHSDHVSGAANLARRYELPIYATPGTIQRGGLRGELRPINCQAPFTAGGVEVVPVTVPHDAGEPCQFVLREGSLSLGILTDLGHVTPHVMAHYGRCSGLLLEFNHDLGMLASGPYPEGVKRRVAGDHGHLNNQQALGMLRAMDLACLQWLVAGHISETNNQVSIVRSLLERELLTWGGQLCVAEQEPGCGWCELV